MVTAADAPELEPELEDDEPVLLLELPEPLEEELELRDVAQLAELDTELVVEDELVPELDPEDAEEFDDVEVPEELAEVDGEQDEAEVMEALGAVEVEPAEDVAACEDVGEGTVVKGSRPAMNDPAAAMTIIAKTIVAPKEVERPRRPLDFAFISHESL